MKLIEAYNLLVEDGIADNHRYFSEVYKLYGFTDDKTLKEYLDFIDHEPVHWLRGFPAKLTTKLAFSKPKTAVIKLLKKQSVINALGAEYVSHIHNKIWNTFKQEVDKIIQERNSTAAVTAENDEAKISLEYDELSVVESLEEEPSPTPPLKTFKTISLYPGHPTHTASLSEISDIDVSAYDRVAFLKSVLLKMSETLPAGAAEAFRLLVSRV